MVILKNYDENTKTQKVWYDSSMFVFTKAIEHEKENKVELYVTFKNGWTYLYKDVKLEDYILLLSGFEESSHGKTLNKVIKPKYEFELIKKGSSSDINEIWSEYFTLQKEEDKKKENYLNTYFISGHRDITSEEFEMYYQEALNTIVSEEKDCRFVVGDCDGVDIMSQNYLIDVLQIDPSSITIYHMKDNPRNINEKIINKVGGFETDSERDEAMTQASFKDIAFVRDEKKLSGTAQNILRRFKMKL